ncbi:MAG: dihydroxyacetone kinase, partial [Chloroflexota bacterium]
MIHGDHLDVEEIRAAISAMGEYPLVVGDAHTVKVHVHVHDPGTPLSYGVSKGALSDVVVENMQAQYQHYIASREAEQALPRAAPAPEIAAIAVVSGPALTQVFRRDLGVAAVVPGGQ